LTKTFTSSAALIFDSPYGILKEEWDVELSYQDWMTVFSNFQAGNNQMNWTAAIWVNWKRNEGLIKAMEDSNYKEITPVIWYKENQTVSGANTSFTNSTELLVVGRHFQSKSTNSDSDIRWSENYPRNRHNFFQGPTKSTYSKDQDGEKINSCEKPSYTIKFFLDKFVHAGQNVVVCGGGAGGEVRGCIEYGCHVSVIEPDKRQYLHLCKMIKTWDAEVERKSILKEKMKIKMAANDSEPKPENEAENVTEKTENEAENEAENECSTIAE
jgi:hypothetical protein